jgi:hypothetical protein
MKNIFAFSLLSLLAMSTYGQDKRSSNADLLIDKPGVVLQREYQNISKVKNVSIIVEYITDMSVAASAKRISALDLEYTTMGDNSQTVSVLIDQDEVQGLISFLENIHDNIIKSAAPKNYTEFSLMTRSGLEAGCYWENTWKPYVKLDSENSKTDVELSSDDLIAFISFIKQAYTKM